MLYDLWNNYNLLERHGNVITRSTHHKLTRNLQEEDGTRKINERVRSLARIGYKLANADDPSLVAGI